MLQKNLPAVGSCLVSARAWLLSVVEGAGLSVGKKEGR